MNYTIYEWMVYDAQSYWFDQGFLFDETCRRLKHCWWHVVLIYETIVSLALNHLLMALHLCSFRVISSSFVLLVQWPMGSRNITLFL